MPSDATRQKPGTSTISPKRVAGKSVLALLFRIPIWHHPNFNETVHASEDIFFEYSAQAQERAPMKKWTQMSLL